MSKKIELKVEVVCEKCKTTIMRSVAKLDGVHSINLDAEKGILTITGTVDVVDVVKELRKAKKLAEVISVGPAKTEEKKDDKKGEKKDEKKDDKKDEKEEECKPWMHPCCGVCRQSGYGQIVVYEEPPNNCIIL